MATATREDTRFRLSNERAEKLATQFGTPLYVIDEAHFRSRIRRYIQAFQSAWPGSELAFASKANSTLAVLAIAHQEGCKIDVASEGELRAALAAGVPAIDCHMHGNNKSRAEIEFALKSGIGMIVVDHFGEIELLGELLRGTSPPCVLRLAPGVDPITHKAISTGQADTKFGFSIQDGSAEKATRRCMELGLPLIGFHCHVGSQLLDPEAQRTGGKAIAEFATRMKSASGFAATYLNLGGGLGVKYVDEDEPIEVEEYCRLVCSSVRDSLAVSSLDPVLGQEPGRALVAESGVTLYRVGVVKPISLQGRTKTYVSVDGGLADNPRPSMYEARYTVEAVSPRVANTIQVTISGRHCESDLLFEDVTLPADIAVGDILQVLCTGAYNSSMASNYNRYPRPATVLVRDNGAFALVQRADSWDEMVAREYLPEGLKK